MWDFFSHSPESDAPVHGGCSGDRGIPAAYRHMDGFGSHTFQWVNAAGERFWVKFHFKTEPGDRDVHHREEAAIVGGQDRVLLPARICTTRSRRGDFPHWTLKVQVMPEAAASGRIASTRSTSPRCGIYRDYPLIPRSASWC